MKWFCISAFDFKLIDIILTTLNVQVLRKSEEVNKSMPFHADMKTQVSGTCLVINHIYFLVFVLKRVGGLCYSI